MKASGAAPIGAQGDSKAARMESAAWKRGFALIGMVVALAVSFVVSLCLGRYGLSPVEVVNVLLNALSGASQPDATAANVVLSVRMPRILMGLLVGAALSVAGAAYQAVFSNPLVSSDILGVSSGASFGAALGILLFGSALAIEGLSLGFGLAAVALVIMLGRVQRRTQIYMLVLAGVIVSALFSALVSLIKYVSDPYDKLPAITTWLMGSMASSSFSDVAVVAGVVLPCCALLWGLRWKLNLLSLDEEEAASLGVDVSRLRLVVIVLATLMTAVTVSLCGVIGWIGLVIPHVGRMLVGNDHRVLVPASVLLGSSYLLIIDDIARIASGAEIPLSILTAIIGAPFFAWILRKTGGSSE